MFRTHFDAAPRRARVSADDSLARFGIALLLVVCVARVLQGLLLEPRLGPGTSLAMLGVLVALRAWTAEIRATRT